MLWIFQSTHPVRGGTAPHWKKCVDAEISIHPPREGWDGGVWMYRKP